MKRAHRILSILLAVAMLLPSQALAADIAPKSQTQQSSIVINEVESDAPNKGNDWVEITNIGAAAVDISGWYLTDDEGEERKTEGKTTPLAEGTVLDPGAFLVLEETVNFDFGLARRTRQRFTTQAAILSSNMSGLPTQTASTPAFRTAPASFRTLPLLQRAKRTKLLAPWSSMKYSPMTPTAARIGWSWQIPLLKSWISPALC